MESISGDEFELNDRHESSTQEEKIFVAVRLRPLNEKEIANRDASDWECMNNTTVIFKNNTSDRPMYPNAYTFGNLSFIHPSRYTFLIYKCFMIDCCS